MYYGMVLFSTVLFGLQFFLNDKYQKENGTGAGAAFTYSFVGALVGTISLAILNKFDFAFTPFTLILAFITAFTNTIGGVCALKALEKSNLSIYSLFSMMGSLILPYLAGILFYNEALTLANVVCVLFVLSSLFITVEGGKDSRGMIYCFGTFFLNGMGGVFLKVYQGANFAKVTPAGYTLWVTVFSAILAGVVLFFIRNKIERPTRKALLLSGGAGVLNRLANLLLQFSLVVLPATVQYPLLTGGVILSSTVISLIAGQKLSKREVISLVLSMIGIIMLIVIPI